MSGKIRWRNSTAMVAVTIVSLIASLSSVALSARPAAAVGIQAAELESQPWCADVLIVGVAGSAQEGYGPEVGSAVAHLKSQINPYKKVRDVPLDYPAAGISTLLGDIATPLDNHWGYFESVGEGQIALLEVLGDSALHCPDEQWILAGYSQGALVINQAGMYLTTYPNRVAGILMIAEPTRTPYNGRTNHGTAHSGGRGISQAFNTYPSNEYPPELDSVTVDVCMESDIVCDYSNWLISLLLPQAGAAVHTSYPEALITAAADSLVPHMPTTRSSPVITDGGREAVAVRWVDSIEHGFPITGYRVQVTKQDNTPQGQDVSAAAGEARFGNIRGGEIVTARVAPLSGLVAGEWSPPSIPFKVLPTEPYSDFNHIGYLGSTTSSVTIRWAYPQHDGGSPVTEYRIGLKQSYPYLANAPEVVTMVPGHLNTTVLEGLPPGTS